MLLALRGRTLDLSEGDLFDDRPSPGVVRFDFVQGGGGGTGAGGTRRLEGRMYSPEPAGKPALHLRRRRYEIRFIGWNRPPKIFSDGTLSQFSRTDA